MTPDLLVEDVACRPWDVRGPNFKLPYIITVNIPTVGVSAARSTVKEEVQLLILCLRMGPWYFKPEYRSLHTHLTPSEIANSISNEPHRSTIH